MAPPVGHPGGKNAQGGARMAKRAPRASKFSENPMKIFPDRSRHPKKKGRNLPLGPLRFAFKTAARVRQSAGGCRNERRSQVGQNKKEIARNRTKLCHHHPTSVWPCALAVLRCAYSCLKNVTAQNRGRRCAPPPGGFNIRRIQKILYEDPKYKTNT